MKTLAVTDDLVVDGCLTKPYAACGSGIAGASRICPDRKLCIAYMRSLRRERATEMPQVQKKTYSVSTSVFRFIL